MLMPFLVQSAGCQSVGKADNQYCLLFTMLGTYQRKTGITGGGNGVGTRNPISVIPRAVTGVTICNHLKLPMTVAKSAMTVAKSAMTE